VYFESSIRKQDYPLLAAAATSGTVEPDGKGWRIDSAYPAVFHMSGPVKLDGHDWAATDGAAVIIPAGRHSIEPSTTTLPVHLTAFSGDPKSFRMEGTGLELAYQSASRAWSVWDARPVRIEMDGEAISFDAVEGGGQWLVALPAGQHRAQIYFSTPILRKLDEAL
jgi:hypothetical protein